jgi:hypothetical protein
VAFSYNDVLPILFEIENHPCLVLCLHDHYHGNNSQTEKNLWIAYYHYYSYQNWERDCEKPIGSHKNQRAILEPKVEQDDFAQLATVRQSVAEYLDVQTTYQEDTLTYWQRLP